MKVKTKTVEKRLVQISLDRYEARQLVFIIGSIMPMLRYGGSFVYPAHVDTPTSVLMKRPVDALFMANLANGVYEETDDVLWFNESTVADMEAKAKNA